MLKRFVHFALLLSALPSFSQVDTVYSNLKGSYFFEHPFIPYSAYTSTFDLLERPYIYSACLELGLLTFEYDEDGSIWPIDTLAPAVFGGLKPTNLWQEEDLLFVSLGGFAGLFPQAAGLAIIDISLPGELTLLGQWDSTVYNQGAAKVLVAENIAYLGAMEKGVISIDVSNPSNPVWLGDIIPDPNYPDAPGLFTTPNARGLCMYGSDKLLISNDHGGLRMLDVTDPENMVETGKYMNWDLYEIAAPAYNNVAVVSHYAYVPVDYCGLDVIDLDTDSMTNVFWFDPWECDSSNWDGAPGHTNEVKVWGDSLLFISGGDSEVLIFDIQNPAEPILKGSYTFPFDSTVAWSIDVQDTLISLALVDNSLFGSPYFSDKGGIILLTWEAQNTQVSISDKQQSTIQVYPNPVNNVLYLELPIDYQTATYRIYLADGHKIQEGRWRSGFPISTADLPPGVFHVLVQTTAAYYYYATFVK